MRTALRRMGNSSGVIIPKPILDQFGASIGDPVEMTVEPGKITLAPVKRKVREGWAESARALTEAGEELAWPEFGNIDDEKLIW